MQNVATAQVVRPIILVKAEFDSADVLMWSGTGDLDWDGQTWIGTGQLLRVDAVEESVEMKAVGTTVTLSGIPSDLLSLALQEDYPGRPLTVYLGAFNDSDEVIASPVILFKGRMDVMTISEGGDTSSIEVTVENRLIDFERPRERRYTSEDQKIDFPNDKGFEFVSTIQDKEIVWGRV
jgi:hypothetical protein